MGKRQCWKTANCGSFRDVADPGTFSTSDREGYKYIQCVDCGDISPVDAESGRAASFVKFGTVADRVAFQAERGM